MTLADVRYNPFSRNPDFRQRSLMARMEKADVTYIHLKGLGIPSDIRKTGDAIGWYRKNVGPSIARSIFDSLERPVCFMCMERDLNCCHRKVILDSLSDQGMIGKELYPHTHLPK